MPVKRTHLWNDLIDRVDLFAEAPPQINLNNKEKVGTMVGFLGTLLIAGTVMTFATTKFYQLAYCTNP
jgi:hypothetical protein